MMILLLLFSISIVHCYNFIDESKKIRQMLLSNLSRFHSSRSISLSDFSLNKEASNLIINSDLMIKASEYFDIETLNSFKKGCKQFKKIIKDFINLRLIEFDPHYFFEEDWFNEIIFKILDDNFPRSMTLGSKSIHDFVELMTLKYVFGEANIPKFMPKYVYLAILSFIHETVYGPDSYVPISSNDWVISLKQKLQKYSLPLTLNYYLAVNNNAAQIEIWRFWSSKPSLEAQSLFIQKHGTSFSLIMKLLFDEDLIPESEDNTEGEAAKKLISTLIYSDTKSLKLLMKIKWTESLKSWAKRTYKDTNKVWYLRYIKDDTIDDALSYVLSRDCIGKPFLLEELESFRPYNARELFFEVLRARMPFVLQLDIASKLISSGLLELETYKPADSNCFYEASVSNLPIYELILMEPKSPVNLFDQRGWGRNSAYLDYLETERLSLAIQTQIIRNGNDPLALLFFAGPILSLSHIISSTSFYNLDVSYSFDGDFSNFACGSFSDRQLRGLVGKVLTFREILEYLNNPKITNLFTKFAFLKDTQTIYPIRSVSNYFNFSKFTLE